MTPSTSDASSRDWRSPYACDEPWGDAPRCTSDIRTGTFSGSARALEADKKAPRKQRHTARRIFERLRDEYAYEGGLSIVKQAVASWRLWSAEVFIPLTHPPGEAQVDFGEAEIHLDGQPAKVALFVAKPCRLPTRSSPPPSRAECTEAFLEVLPGGVKGAVS